MHWALLSLQIILFATLSVQLSAQDVVPNPEDSIAQYVMRQIKAEVQSKGYDQVVDVYKENLPFIRLDDSLFSEAIIVAPTANSAASQLPGEVIVS